MLKFALAHHATLRHTLLYSSKTWNDVIFREALTDLASRYPDRLAVVHTLTRENDSSVFGPSVRKGRMSRELLQEVIPDPSAPLVYVCGPGISKWDIAAAEQRGTEPPAPRFLETVLSELRAIGVPANRITRECYG